MNQPSSLYIFSSIFFASLCSRALSGHLIDYTCMNSVFQFDGWDSEATTWEQAQVQIRIVEPYEFFQFDTQQIRVLCVLFWPLSVMRNISRVETRIFFFSWLSSKALFIQTTPSKATFRTTTKNVWNWAKTGSNEKPFLFPWHHTHREDLIEFQYPPSEGIKTDRSLFSQPEGALVWSMNHIHATHPTY